MRKKIIAIGLSVIISAAMLTGCGKSEEVKNTESLIEGIATEVTADAKDSIDAAEEAFEALSDDDKEKVDGSEMLSYYVAAEDYIQSILEYNKAVESFNQKAAEVNDANSDFNDYLDGIKDSGILEAKAYDPDTITALEKAVSDAAVGMDDDIDEKKDTDVVNGEDISKLKVKEIEEMTSDLEGKIETMVADTDSVNQETEKIVIPDYSDAKEEVQKAWDEAKDSVAIQDQITNPSEDFVISRLLEIDGISDAQAVTEDHDPNGLLHKAGGYTAQVYFSYDLVDQSLLLEDNLIDEGTDAGGSIEVYEDETYVNKRNTYLTGFDGSAIGVGSHTILGTCIVRTSDHLTASQQKDLEKKIIEVLTRLDKKD